MHCPPLTGIAIALPRPNVYRSAGTGLKQYGGVASREVPGAC